MRVVAAGSSLKVYRDGEEILSATDASITQGPVALFCDGNGDAYFDDVLLTSLADPVTTTHQYNSANELTTQTEGGTATTFYYDTWGRMYSKTQGSYSATYAYKYGDKLVSITSNFPDEGTVYYKYGGDGKRRERSTPNPASYTWYNWSGWNVISEEDSGGDLQMIYVGGLAHIEDITPSGGTYRYYFHDHLGSVRNVKNEDKSLYASYEYTPYGQVYDHSGSDVKHRFTGQEWDETAQLYYFPFRYYSPGIARWTTREPRGLNGPNIYWYALANPISVLDVLGLKGCSDVYNDDWIWEAIDINSDSPLPAGPVWIFGPGPGPNLYNPFPPPPEPQPQPPAPPPPPPEWTPWSAWWQYMLTQIAGAIALPPVIGTIEMALLDPSFIQAIYGFDQHAQDIIDHTNPGLDYDGPDYHPEGWPLNWGR